MIRSVTSRRPCPVWIPNSVSNYCHVSSYWYCQQLLSCQQLLVLSATIVMSAVTGTVSSDCHCQKLLALPVQLLSLFSKVTGTVSGYWLCPHKSALTASISTVSIYWHCQYLLAQSVSAGTGSINWNFQYLYSHSQQFHTQNNTNINYLRIRTMQKQAVDIAPYLILRELEYQARWVRSRCE